MAMMYDAMAYALGVLAKSTPEERVAFARQYDNRPAALKTAVTHALEAHTAVQEILEALNPKQLVDVLVQEVATILPMSELPDGSKMHGKWIREYDGDVFVVFDPTTDGALIVGAGRSLKEAVHLLADVGRNV